MASLFGHKIISYIKLCFVRKAISFVKKGALEYGEKKLYYQEQINFFVR